MCYEKIKPQVTDQNTIEYLYFKLQENNLFHLPLEI